MLNCLYANRNFTLQANHAEPMTVGASALSQNNRLTDPPEEAPLPDLFGQWITECTAFCTQLEKTLSDSFESLLNRAETMEICRTQATATKAVWDQIEADTNQTPRPLPDSVKQFILDYQLTIEGVYENGNWIYAPTSSTSFTADQVQSVYNALGSFSETLGSSGPKESFRVQGIAQSLSNTYTILNQIQAIRNELCKMLIQGIR